MVVAKAPRTTTPRPTSFGESPRELLKRELHVPDLLIMYGKIYVDEARMAKSGKKYRSVTVSFRDDQGEECRLKKVYFEGQCYHADVFVPYNEKVVLFCAGEIDTQNVEAVLHKDGKRTIFIYKVGELFLLSLNALRPASQTAQPEPEPIPEPISPPQKEAPLTTDWDADLPDETLPESPRKEEKASPRTGVMNPAQLADEQQRYWADMANAIPSMGERHIFLETQGFPRDFQGWTEQDFPRFKECLQRWFDVISPEHPLGHDNWDQPVQAEHREQILKIAQRWPDPRAGKLVVRELLTKRGYNLLADMKLGELECLRLELLADPRCPKA